MILAWYAELAGWKALRAKVKTQRQIAKELNLSNGVVSAVIRTNGAYRKPCPTKK